MKTQPVSSQDNEWVLDEGVEEEVSPEASSEYFLEEETDTPTLEGKTLDPVTTRDYMVRRFGVKYKNAPIEQVMEDAREHMRFFGTNEVSAARELFFINTTDEASKVAASQFYEQWDNEPNFWSKDSESTVGEALGDYAEAIVTSPSSYIGFVVGGLLAKGGAAATSAAVREGARIAALRAASAIKTRGLTGAALAAAKTQKTQAAKAAARSYIAKNAGAGSGKVLLGGGRSSAAAARAKAIGKYGAPVGAAGSESLAAVATDLLQQGAYIGAGNQEEVRGGRLAVAGALGAAGGLADIGLQSLKKSKFDPSNMVTDIYGSRQQRLRTATQAAGNIVNNLQSVVQPLTDWVKLRNAGRANLGPDTAMPPDVMKAIVLGQPGKDNGLIHAMAKSGVAIDEDRLFTEQVASFITNLPGAQRGVLNQYLRQNFNYGVDELAEDMAASVNLAGQTNQVMSEASKLFGAQVMANQATLNAATGATPAVKKVTTSDYISYFQDVWRKLLVTNLGTSALNFSGSAAYFTGDVISQLMQGGAYALTGRGQEATQMIKAAGARVGRMFETKTTRETFRNLLFLDDNTFRTLRYVTANGVKDADTMDRLLKSYNFDVASGATKAGVKVTETGLEVLDRLNLVSFQDVFWKSQFLMGELDVVARKKFGVSIEELIRSGRYKELSLDDKGQAIHKTLQAVFSADYTPRNQEIARVNSLFADFAGGVEYISNVPFVGTMLPFGKFLNNVVYNTYQFTPIQTVIDTAKFAAGKGDGPLMADAMKGVIGTTAVLSAAQFAYDNPDLPWNMLPDGNGEFIDISNSYPISYIRVAGEIIKRLATGEEVTGDLAKVFGENVALGAFAEGFNLEALNEALTEVLNGRISGDAAGQALGKFFAGFTRPFAIGNDYFGIARGDTVARDRKQEVGFSDNFAAQATRNVDKLFNAMLSRRTEDLEGKDTRVATRPGSQPVEEPTFKILTGAKKGTLKTKTEQALAMADMPTWMGNVYSESPEYNRIANEIIVPDFEALSGFLMKSDAFVNGSTRKRRIMMEGMIKNLRASVTAKINGSGDKDWMSAGMAKKLLDFRKKNSDVYFEALERLGFEESNPRRMGFTQLRQLELAVGMIQEEGKIGQTVKAP